MKGHKLLFLIYLLLFLTSSIQTLEQKDIITNVKDLIKKCTKKQKIIILNEIFYNIVNLSLNEYSNHCIQTLIEKASSKEEII